jgi:hypothetical protein
MCMSRRCFDFDSTTSNDLTGLIADRKHSKNAFQAISRTLTYTNSAKCCQNWIIFSSISLDSPRTYCAKFHNQTRCFRVHCRSSRKRCLLRVMHFSREFWALLQNSKWNSNWVLMMHRAKRIRKTTTKQCGQKLNVCNQCQKIRVSPTPTEDVVATTVTYLFHFYINSYQGE